MNVLQRREEQNSLLPHLCICQAEVEIMTHMEDSEMGTNTLKYHFYRCSSLGEQRESKNTEKLSRVIFLQKEIKLLNKTPRMLAELNISDVGHVVMFFIPR